MDYRLFDSVRWRRAEMLEEARARLADGRQGGGMASAVRLSRWVVAALEVARHTKGSLAVREGACCKVCC